MGDEISVPILPKDIPSPGTQNPVLDELFAENFASKEKCEKRIQAELKTLMLSFTRAFTNGQRCFDYRFETTTQNDRDRAEAMETAIRRILLTDSRLTASKTIDVFDAPDLDPLVSFNVCFNN